MIAQHRPELSAFATAQSMRDAMVSSVVIAMVDQLRNVDQVHPVMPMSIAHSKGTPSSAQSAVVFCEHKRSLLTRSAQRAKLETGNGVSLSPPTG